MRLLIVALFVCLPLAGCADAADGPDTPLDREDVTLGAGRGAIAGLLVDDRFRPIQLTDDPKTDFQTTGFVLLQETGQQVRTNENGEFLFTDLEPGQYTLRVSAGGHEATPQRAQVTEGVFEEVSLVARRVVSDAGTIITNEYSVFIACAADYFVNGGNLPCDVDLSPDSYESYYESDLTGLKDVTYVVTDFRANQESGYHIQIRGSEGRYATAIWVGDRIQITMAKGEVQTEWEEAELYSPNVPFENDVPFDTIFFVEHDLLRAESPGCCGLGVTMGVKGQFVQSVFLGPPEVDLASYCTLC